jgi:hypothetical protein
MPTVTLDAYSKAYPSIVNRIRASVFLETDPAALIATIIDITVGHPARIWHFPGLPRANYGFSLDEIDAGGLVVQNLALFSVVPSQIDGYLTRKDEQIKVGTTPGFDTGATQAWFDGRETAPGSGIFHPNYIGWDIVPSELTGRGILVEGLDYSWDEATGEFNLLQAGDILPESIWYNIHFNPSQTSQGGGVPTINDFSTRIVTEDDNIEVDDFGNNIVVEPDGVYLELYLPDINTVPQGRPVRIETKQGIGTDVQCVRIVPQEMQEIKFLDGTLLMMNNEALEIYRVRRDDESNEWRVRAHCGNFGRVGESVADDFTQVGVYCKQLLDGSIKDKLQYARIYEQVVLKLPATQVMNFDTWNVGNNKYFFSLANSADPGNANKFHFPDRRDLFERNNNAGKAGDYQADSMRRFWPNGMTAPSILDVNGQNTEIGVDPGAGSPDIKTQRLINTTLFNETETRPKNYLINKYVLI